MCIAELKLIRWKVMSAGGNQPVISILFLFLYSEVYKSVARVPVHYPDQMK